MSMQLFNDLQECYLQKRHQFANHPQYQPEREKNVIPREGYSAGLADFQSVPSTFTQYSRLRVIAELKHGDRFHPANIVSSTEFDCDDELEFHAESKSLTFLQTAVSYVKFLSNNELASASTDSTLRSWDVKENLPDISKPVAWHRFAHLKWMILMRMESLTSSVFFAGRVAVLQC
ncbi:E3 UBIQUITIN-PROTEIN LIGASE COP1 [Salix viminalis]|uniref:E3 UBIQUITIN-PROTEIN LIGASE COP1 n=1 Tax=Salix viminalis TaxID=40686 RepID=A0A9Q0UFM0_SALVM|nr:E3 UBIQUITIN-PROTEIN LIGASE COP1 [Salix viminalis]